MQLQGSYFQMLDVLDTILSNQLHESKQRQIQFLMALASFWPIVLTEASYDMQTMFVMSKAFHWQPHGYCLKFRATISIATSFAIHHKAKKHEAVPLQAAVSHNEYTDVLFGCRMFQSFQLEACHTWFRTLGSHLSPTSFPNWLRQQN